MAKDEFSPAVRKKIIDALVGNWQAEMEGYHTYHGLANNETDAIRAHILRHLAEDELDHARLWGERIKELGGNEPVYTGPEHGHADSVQTRAGGPIMALRRLEIEESRHIATYGKQLRELGDQKSMAVLEHIIAEEREHHRELSSLIRGHYTVSEKTPKIDPKAVLDEMLKRRDKGRPQAGAWIGDAIYGVNDGLGAIFGIVSGVSGATAGDSKAVLIAGIAGMVASALSMGSGAYLAAKSEREIYQAELVRERESVHMNSAEARELLSLYYQVKGLPIEDADRVAEQIAKDRDQMVKALAFERLNMSEDGLSNPVVSAISGMISTAVGSFIPIIPFFFIGGLKAVIWAAAISLAAHFAVGAAKSLITVRSWWSSGFEMTVVGAIEGAVTYGIGLLLGGAAM